MLHFQEVAMNTKEKYVGIFWGAVLILLGAVFLVTGSRPFQITNPWLGMALNGGLSLVFFISYYLSGVQKWGWLFPACIFAGTTLTILLSQIFPGSQGGWIAAPVLLSIAVPFLVAYSQDREKRAWALIPAFVMIAVTLVAAVADLMQGELVGTFVLLLIALPFLVVYLRNRARRWALIVAGVLAVNSLIPALSAGLNEDLVGPAVMFLFAAPFFVVYFTGIRRWWALLVGGIFATLGVVTLVTLQAMTNALGGEPLAGQVAGAVFFLGLGLTFLVLWLRRSSAPTAWAIYPASVLGALALVTLMVGRPGYETAWPIIFIASGVLLLFVSFRKRLV